jgi:hypothetical protein
VVCRVLGEGVRLVLVDDCEPAAAHKDAHVPGPREPHDEDLGIDGACRGGERDAWVLAAFVACFGVVVAAYAGALRQRRVVEGKGLPAELVHEPGCLVRGLTLH